MSDVCETCSKLVSKNRKGTKCFGTCNKMYHYKCIGIPEEFEKYKELGLSWTCSHCRESTKQTENDGDLPEIKQEENGQIEQNNEYPNNCCSFQHETLKCEDEDQFPKKCTKQGNLPETCASCNGPHPYNPNKCSACEVKFNGKIPKRPKKKKQSKNDSKTNNISRSEYPDRHDECERCDGPYPFNYNKCSACKVTLDREFPKLRPRRYPNLLEKCTKCNGPHPFNRNICFECKKILDTEFPKLPKMKRKRRNANRRSKAVKSLIKTIENIIASLSNK